MNRAVPPALAAIVDRCLAKNPAHRYQSADELLSAIDGALAEPDRRPVPIAPPSLVSDTEAHAVWQRAADLQASTGLVPRPDAIPRPRDAARDRARTSGFAVDDVRVAASEAGIGERYVEHALVEHGLVSPRRPDAPISQRASLWAGIPLDVVRQVEVDGEVPTRTFDRLINVIHEKTGRLGRTVAKTRELFWGAGGAGARLEVSVVPDQGRTTIRVERNVRRAAVGGVASTVVVVGAGAPVITVC